jgi:two-component system OmpR family sensor kinase
MQPTPQDPTLAAMYQDRLFESLTRLLALEATSVHGTLAAASDLIAGTMLCEKVDAFLLDADSQTLVAVGASDTPLAQLQRSLGLDRLPLANGGRAVEVFQTGAPYHCGDVRADAGELRGLREAMGIQSALGVPLAVAGQRRGVLHVTSTRRDAFDRRDQTFLAAVAHWTGMVVHRAELVEKLEREAVLQGRRDAAEELIVVFSHDLRNHLWTLSTRLQVLQLRAAEAGRRDDVEELDRLAENVGRLNRLARDLLDVERLERGLFALTPELADVSALVRDTARLVATPGTPIEVHAPATTMLAVDGGALCQTLENLLSNARAHSPAGAPIQVEVRERPGEVAISIRDFGPGISDELMPRLFRRGSRGSGSQHGLGLGLYLARRLTEAQGGTLDVEPHDGPGACFKIVLPALSAPA